jgi:hypothetical protein
MIRRDLSSILSIVGSIRGCALRALAYFATYSSNRIAEEREDRFIIYNTLRQILLRIFAASTARWPENSAGNGGVVRRSRTAVCNSWRGSSSWCRRGGGRAWRARASAARAPPEGPRRPPSVACHGGRPASAAASFSTRSSDTRWCRGDPPGSVPTAANSMPREVRPTLAPQCWCRRHRA